MVRRKEVAVVSVAAAGLAVTARVVMSMLRRSHSGEEVDWGMARLISGDWIWGIRKLGFRNVAFYGVLGRI